MIIYNVTVNIDNSVREEWLDWMKNVHIPDVVATGCFVEGNIFKVLVDEEQGTSYSIQYRAKHMDDVVRYRDEHMPRLQQEHTERYKEKFVAFRTLLERV